MEKQNTCYLAILEYPPQEKMTGGFGLRLIVEDKEHNKLLVHNASLTMDAYKLSNMELVPSGFLFWAEDTPEFRERMTILAEVPLFEIAEAKQKHFNENIKTIYELPTQQKIHEEVRGILNAGLKIYPNP